MVKTVLWMIFVISILIPQIIFRFKHAEMTETELFLNIIEAYRVFFNSLASL